MCMYLCIYCIHVCVHVYGWVCGCVGVCVRESADLCAGFLVFRHVGLTQIGGGYSEVIN